MLQRRLAQSLKLYKYTPPDLLSTEGANLPEAYKKFYREWKLTTPQPVHFRPNPAKWTRNEETGEVQRIDNLAIPVLFPPESHYGIWGGEGVIKGFQKRTRHKARVPHFWVPNLKKSAVYSEILNKTFSVTVTDRTIDLILHHKGFDNYLLETRACDLQSGLALKFKQKMLHALYYKELNYSDPDNQNTIYNKYKHFLEQYTKEEIEWYGLTFDEALRKLKNMERAVIPEPAKHRLRYQLLEKLLEDSLTPEDQKEPESKPSWFSRINPFGKKG